MKTPLLVPFLVMCLASTTSVPASVRTGDDVQQFAVGEHVLAFTEESVYLTGSDHMLRVTFRNANPATPQVAQFHSPEAKVQRFATVTYPDLWDGITHIYENLEGGIAKCSYLVSPGSDVGLIALQYNVPVWLDDAGQLVFQFDTGTLTETAPIAWQTIDDERHEVAVEYCAYGDRTIGFTVGEYDPAYSLIIDPEWQWNTFMGSSSPDRGRGIAVDGSGNVYIVGYSGASWGEPINGHAGWVDAFVAKLNGDGQLQWSTFLGGSTYEDYGKGIALDLNGNVYVVGESDATWGSPVNEYAGGSWDVFVAKLDGSGELLWNTFLGSSGTEYGEGIAVDGNGDVCVTGWSDATWGSPVSPHSGNRDGFVAKLDGSGLLQWNTFVGSSLSDESYDIAVDGSGNMYVAGMSRATWGAPIAPHSGSRDGFVAKLNSGGVVQWNTFMGGSRTDYCESIALGDNNSVYVCGWSDWAWGSPNSEYKGGDDGFAAKLNNSGVMLWSTFLGSTSGDGANCIAVDASGNAYVAGESKITWGTPVHPFTGDGYEDGFAAKLNSAGLLQWNTFMGASEWDYGIGIAVDASGYIHIVGSTYANAWGSPVNPHAGWGYDAFAVKFDYSSVVGVEGVSAVPTEFMLLQNYPNPFNPSTTIRYGVPMRSHVKLTVVNTLGQEVAVLQEGEKEAGYHDVKFDATGLASGVYMYRLRVHGADSAPPLDSKGGPGDFVQTKKLVLVR